MISILSQGKKNVIRAALVTQSQVSSSQQAGERARACVCRGMGGEEAGGRRKVVFFFPKNICSCLSLCYLSCRTDKIRFPHVYVMKIVHAGGSINITRRNGG